MNFLIVSSENFTFFFLVRGDNFQGSHLEVVVSNRGKCFTITCDRYPRDLISAGKLQRKYVEEINEIMIEQLNLSNDSFADSIQSRIPIYRSYITLYNYLCSNWLLIQKFGDTNRRRQMSAE